MTLDQLLRCALPAVVASFYACGSEGPAPALGGAVSQPCRSDTDCKGERVCVDGYCKNPAGSVEGPCGNSPLTGKYLWFTECGSGMETPFSPNCSGILTDISSPEGQEVTKKIQLSYNDLTLTVDSPGLKVRTLRLISQFSDSDLPRSGKCYELHAEGFQSHGFSYEEGITKLAALARCYISAVSSLYVLEVDGEVCLNGPPYVLIRDEPWPGRQDLCRQQLRELYNRLTQECPSPFQY